jgi:heme/copper-type cytochrome/quinol oxidase subunit 3
LLTIKMGATFLGFQLFEYLEAPFSISSSVYGSIFFLATGFHGFHVTMGLVFILVCFFRYRLNHF